MPFLQRECTEKNKMKFVVVMSRLDWEDIYSATDMQCAFSLFHSKLIDADHRCFPEKSFTRTYHIRKPWLTSCLRDAFRKKNRLYYKSIKIKCIRTKKMYEDYRNQLRNLMRAAEKEILHRSNLGKQTELKKNSGQLSKALLIEIRRLNFKKKLNWMMAHTLQIWK